MSLSRPPPQARLQAGKATLKLRMPTRKQVVGKISLPVHESIASADIEFEIYEVGKDEFASNGCRKEGWRVRGKAERQSRRGRAPWTYRSKGQEESKGQDEANAAFTCSLTSFPSARNPEA